MLEPGINKPFDRIAKDFADEAPLVFLRLLGIAPEGTAVKLEPLRPETAPQVVMPDYVASMEIEGEDPCIFHVEFFLRYRREIPETMARYGCSLAWQYRRPVRSIVLLLGSGGCPDEIPDLGVEEIGYTKITHEFQTARLWELDPEPVLSAGKPGLLPWALLMRLGREEAYRLGAKVAETRNEQSIANFLTLGAVRYHRSELEQMLGGKKMGLVECIMEGSSIVKEYTDRATEQGLAEGLAKGTDKGKVEEARRLLTLALARRFPGLEASPEIDRIASLSDLESLLLDHAIRTDDREAMALAIRDAASKS